MKRAIKMGDLVRWTDPDPIPGQCGIGRVAGTRPDFVTLLMDDGGWVEAPRHELELISRVDSPAGA